MKIQIGEIYMDKVTNSPTLYTNKTRKYLLPCLKAYGAHFMTRLDNVFKIAVGIGDIVISNRGFKHEKHLFILLESVLPITGGKRRLISDHFIEFLDWIKTQPMYEDDYVFDNIQKTTSHMVILKLPLEFYDTFETFKLGEYSKMYSKVYVDKFFKARPEIKRVLVKDHNYKLEFVGKINRRWGSSIKASEWEGELDDKPDNKEIFNHHLIKKR